MDLFNFFKGLFIPSDRGNQRHDDPRSQFLRTEERLPSNLPSNEPPVRNEDITGFPIFSNPLEMHRYFEKQMNDVLKTFGFQGENSFFGFDDGGAGPSFDGFIEGPEFIQPDSGNLRDLYLKPGYQQPNPNGKAPSDTDLDGKIQTKDLDSIFKSDNELAPYQPQYPQQRFHSFGQSVMSKTVRNPDGSMETHKTVKDSQGNEETIVTKKWGDKEYTVTTKTNKDGKQEVIENLTNLDEQDLQKFLQRGHMPEILPTTKQPHNWFPFDKYFS